MKIIIGIVAILFCYSLLTRKYINIYRLYLIFGKKGSGKSTYLVKLAYKHLKRGWAVYTNMDELKLPGLRHINIDHLGMFVPEKHSILLLDEVGMIWDARDFKKFRPEVRDFFKLQRHYRVKVYLASQTFDVDKKIRDLTDGMYLHVCIGRVFSVGKRITRKIVLTESSSEAESRISEDLRFCPPWDWTITYIPRWAKYFDSHAIPIRSAIKYHADPPLEKKTSIFPLSLRKGGRG